MVMGSLGLAGAFTVPAAPASAAPSSTATSVPAQAATFAAPSASSSLAPGSAATLGKQALALSQKDGIPSHDVYVPNANINTKPVSATGGHVEPLYSFAPAPMGLADYGLTNTTGTVVPSLQTTTSVAGTFSTNSSTGVQPFYMDSGTPDGYSIQLNSVLVNVSLGGSTSTNGTPNEFWTQNVVFYAAELHQLEFLDNVWSFWPGFAPNTFASYGPNGTFVYPEYYYAVGPTINISYPFTVGLYLNSTVIDGDNAVFFNYTLQNATVSIAGSYDYVIFNSAGTATPGEATYQADGYNYDPIGLTNDYEIMIGGPGGGSTTDLLAVDATMTLSYWNATAGAYEAVPSAYNFGGETGETSTGANVWYQGTTAHLSTGPSILQGLWNNTGVTGNPGLTLVHLNITPSNAFLFVERNNSSPGGFPGATPYPQWAPTVGPSLPGAGWLTGVIPMTPGSYEMGALLSGYVPYIFFVNLTAGAYYLNINLTWDPNYAGYTPLYAWEDSQLAAISIAGNGSVGNPYVLENQTSPGGLVNIFGLYNDYIFPEFMGIFFIGISDYVDISTPSLYIQFPGVLGSPSYIPNYNYLQIVIAYSTNIAIVNDPFIGGWFFTENSWADPANVMLFNDGSVLVANNSFWVSAIGLFVYNSASSYNGGITIWGNTFNNDFTDYYYCYFGCAIDTDFAGLQLSANGDLIYNNAFNTLFTAYTPTFDWWTIAVVYPVVSYLDTWNISRQDASNVNYAPGFPNVPLSGSIIGTSYQGGNYWVNYGTPGDPYGILPYNNEGEITNGGDYVPLTTVMLYSVTVSVSGAPSGLLWWIYIYNSDYSLVALANGTGIGNVTVQVPNGTYFAYGAVGTYSSPTGTPFVVNGSATNTSFVFPPLYTVNFVASGVGNTTTAWEIFVSNQTLFEYNYTLAGDSITFLLPNGAYQFDIYVESDSIAAVPYTGGVTVNGTAATVAITFEVAYVVTLVPVDLPGNELYVVYLQYYNGSATSLGAYNLTTELPNGTYSGYYYAENTSFQPNYLAPQNFTFVVAGQNVTVYLPFSEQFAVTFTQSGLPSYDQWSITIDGSLVATLPGNATSYTVELGNGTYSYIVGTTDPQYHAVPGSGNFTVFGSPTGVNNAFVSSASHLVVFSETGLPGGATWLVQVNGVNLVVQAGQPIDWVAPSVGVYTFYVGTLLSNWVASPASGMVTVGNTTQYVDVSFAPYAPTYQVLFTASGVYAGTTWSLTFNGSVYTTSNLTLVIDGVAPGSYGYTVSAPAGYTVSPPSGTVQVVDRSVSLGVTFSLITYTVTFSETGLPSGTHWSVMLNGVLIGSTTAWINFTVVPGTYNYIVGNITGWTATPTTGSVTVSSSSVIVNISFAAAGHVPRGPAGPAEAAVVTRV